MDKVFEKHNLQNLYKSYEKNYTWTEFNDDGAKVVHTEYWIVWAGDYLKWYDQYEDVRAVNKCINDLGDKGFMVALGEDNVLHSERGEWYDFVDHISKLEII